MTKNEQVRLRQKIGDACRSITREMGRHNDGDIIRVGDKDAFTIRRVTEYTFTVLIAGSHVIAGIEERFSCGGRSWEGLVYPGPWFADDAFFADVDAAIRESRKKRATAEKAKADADAAEHASKLAAIHAAWESVKDGTP